MTPRYLGACVVIVICLVALPAAAGDLVLKRVMLSTGGVAYLEYEAEVTGDAALALDLPLDQVDDVLKSIVVYDSKGGIGSASLPGREPLAQIFSDLQFGPAALASPAALLNALQGAEIRVGSSHPVTGKLLRVVPETTRSADNTTTTRNRVSLLTSAGLQQFILEEAESVSFAEPALQAQVDKALAEIAAHRAKDRRQVTLAARGVGSRTLRVGYVVAAPLWKASFRVTLPQEPDAAKAHLQGWAVLENMSGQDWKGVELTLLSGNPVSFRQAIYQAYYVQRPEVPVEVSGRILPRPDIGVMSGAAGSASGAAAAPALKEFRGLAAHAPAYAENALDAASRPQPMALAASVDTAEAAEGATQVSFRVPVPVSIASGQSAIVPIVDRDVPIARLALYQPGTAASHPLATLKVANDGTDGLPPGVVTLYERGRAGVAYVGDARLSGLPAGENRLLSYAVDDKTKIAREAQASDAIGKATAAQGVLHIIRMDRQTTVYRLAAPAGEPRRVILEQAKAAGWQLVAPAEREVDQTATHYRLAVDLKPGETRTVSVTVERPREDIRRIADLDNDQIMAMTSSRELDSALKAALGELARLRRVAAEKKAAQDQVAGEIAALQTDQVRIRENLRTIDRDSAVHKRYIEKLFEQETRMETLQAQNAKAAEETRAAAASIEAYIAKLSI